MPLPGGAADKAGNRYELMWTVLCMIDVMQERAGRIRIEPPGPEGDGAEFILVRAGRLEHHQVKRQQAGKGHWNIRDMAGVLDHARRKLADPGVSCLFVSMEAAGELRELHESAVAAVSFEEFKSAFLGASTRLGPFRNLCGVWSGCPEENAFALLPRIRAETISEVMLRDTVDGRLAPLVTGDPATVRDILAQFALASVHRDLTALDIWQHLEERGHRPLDWARNSTVAGAVTAQNDRYLASQQHDIGGIDVPRAEARAIMEAFTQPEAPARTVFLTGEAGVGKTGVTRAVVLAVRDDLGWPVLALRVDRLDPTQSARAVGEQLGLPGSPTATLAALAQGRSALLVIDQLDAVSSASGRNPEFFATINEILREAAAHPNLHVLIVCRGFDLQNDARLRALRQRDQTAPEVPVGPLLPETVRETVAVLGLDPARLSEGQIRLLALPLHLMLFATVARTAAEAALSIQTAKDLFDTFWMEKRTRLAERRFPLAAWEEPLHALSELMSEQQALSVPQGQLRGRVSASDIDAMVSEHVLVADGNRLSFFHEAFFDYAFARFFVEDGEPVGAWLRASEQHLFRRAQVRQILVYRRDADFAGYLEDLRDLLTGVGVRAHIRQTAFAVLGAMGQPHLEEWRLLEPLIGAPELSMRRAARNALFRSVGWFLLLDRIGTIEGWLDNGEEDDRDLALNLMRHYSNREPDRVAALLMARLDRDDAWRTRVSQFMTWCPAMEASESLLRVLLAVVERGDFSVLKNRQAGFWGIVHRLPKHHPDHCAVAIGAYLRRLVEETAEPRPFDEDRGSSEKVVEACADGAPAEFVDVILPLFLELTERFADRDGPSPYLDRLWWDAAFLIRHRHSLSGALLSGLSKALVRLATLDVAAFEKAAEQLAASPCRSAHVLLMHAYAGAGAAMAEQAGQYLAEHWKTYGVGERGGRHWAARELLENVAPYMSQAGLRALEPLILSWYPPSEREPRPRRGEYWGCAQHLLLDVIPTDRLSDAGRRRQAELRRKFAGAPFQRPREMRARRVVAPIPSEATQRMSDVHWLRAMARYTDPHERRWDDDRVFGGAGQVAYALQERAKAEPVRFASLCLRMPPDTRVDYVSAVLRGVASAQLPGETVLALCRRAHEVPGRPCGREIAALVSGHAPQALPDEVFGILRWYGEEDPDPQDDAWREHAADDGSYNGDPHFHGYNSVRGAVAEAMATLLFDDPERFPRLEALTERLLSDPMVSVRSCAAEILIALLNRDEALAVSSFLRLIDTDDAILAARPVEEFIRYAAYRDVATLRPVLERMLNSTDDKVAQAGARQACLAALSDTAAQPLAERALAGRVAHRKGAAQVYSQNVGTAAVRSPCVEGLRRLFRDSDSAVREEAAGVMWHLRNEELSTFLDLFLDFTVSPAFLNGADRLLMLLEEAAAIPPDLLFTAVERLTAAADEDAERNFGHTASEALALVIRMYKQASDPALQARCLDIIDRLAESNVYGFENALVAYDR